MAIRYNNTLFPDSTVAANIRLWAQFVEDTLVTTGGWAVTSDTGQTLPSALTVTTGPNQKKGFRVYRMTDALQATAPVFMRLNFGSANAQGAALWITIGTGSDGSGNITGVLWNNESTLSPACGSGQASTTALTDSFGSASPSRLCLGMLIHPTIPAYSMVFCIERSKDATGADTGAGLLLSYGGGCAESTNVNAVARSRYIVMAGGTQPFVETGLNYIITSLAPTQSFAPGDIGVGVVFHFKGLAQQPGTNILVTNFYDVSLEGQVSLSLYGQQRTYQQLGIVVAMHAGSATTLADTNSRILMRYD